MALRVGVIGTGFAGGTHARALRSLEGVEVAAIAAATTAEAAALAAECGARVADSAAALAADPAIDLVVVASPTYLHAEHAIAAARAGKHVFCEKPLARTVEQATAIVEACERAGVTLAVGHVVRFFPDYTRVKELLDSGGLGRPALATMTRGTFPVGEARGWYLDAEKSGRVVLDLMLHDLDAIRWWFGEPDHLYARSLGGTGALDYALATVRYLDGPIVHLEASWAEHSGFGTTFEIRGTAGLVTHDSRTTAPVRTQAPRDAEAAMMPPTTLLESPYVRQLRDLVARLRDGQPPRVSGRDALNSLGLALAVDRSARERRVVDWRPIA